MDASTLAVVAPAEPGQPANPIAAEEKPTQSPPAKPAHRWLPQGTQLLVAYRPAGQPEGWEELRRTVVLAGPACNAAWELGIGRVIDAFGLRRASLDRLTWASTDLGDWSNHAVVLIELAASQDAGMLRSALLEMQRRLYAQ